MNFLERINAVNPEFMTFKELETVQVNLGNLCNLQCTHCHIEASPVGDNVMSLPVIKSVVTFLSEHPGLILDVTGGCPEMNPHFEWLIENARSHVSRLMVRTNMAILAENQYAHLSEFYKKHHVVLIGSLPCYLKENVDRIRGDQTYEKNIQVLRQLNALGYGDQLELNLVYNPGGDFLPPDQAVLERDYRVRLKEDHGVIFSHLYTLANAPIGRFAKCLEQEGSLHSYQEMLSENFNPDAAASIMCRSLISINYLGELYPCDFHLAIKMPVRDELGHVLKVEDLDNAIVPGRPIEAFPHCFVCTAGSGTSCTGALAAIDRHAVINAG